jgi:hypothetical protein
MELTIEQALGNQWAMFYHSQWPVEDLQPVCTLEQSMRTVNQQLQSVRDLSQWKYAHQDEIARLLWRSEEHTSELQSLRWLFEIADAVVWV